jgi:adenine/guanine/hypoxanthine permease
MRADEWRGRGIMFDLEANGTTVRTELIAGLTTYLTMVYIAFVNPTILAATGMDKGAVFVATCLAAAFGSALMGLYANYPVALAPEWGSTPISPTPS